ncbi:PaaI family thioesterase [Nocardioides marmoribigeumensis]|uniref:Acyl-coenzyme A thioesterase PaaI-like protein n=1 Tax=Nocardioides marmoribigeumensis TaxID=433649 RepID=A0ABU2BWK7_9ACTN|nr:PaaI family thioesterase [Nocardioides marmoribigeumensis]MDR7362549.1 acyl-coenzyme A thioesterase PaaI-like protein [Nocardioides marmoribigeumensis]
MSELSLGSFSFEDVPTEEVEAAEELYGGLAADVRRLVDVTIRSRVDAGRVAEARELVQGAADVLARDALDGPAGVHYNAHGRSWNWGNTVVGVRNAFAPPVRLVWGDDDVVRSAVTLGAAYEGPPGSVHGGVSALLLDHLMGETASARHTRLTVTGTLTLRYERPIPLGPVRMEARVGKEEGRKVTVEGWIGPDDDSGPSVRASGLFIVPSWAAGPHGADPTPPGGSLD